MMDDAKRLRWQLAQAEWSEALRRRLERREDAAACAAEEAAAEALCEAEALYFRAKLAEKRDRKLFAVQRILDDIAAGKLDDRVRKMSELQRDPVIREAAAARAKVLEG